MYDVCSVPYCLFNEANICTPITFLCMYMKYSDQPLMIFSEECKVKQDRHVQATLIVLYNTFPYIIWKCLQCS